jgi:hypothetical protein
MALWLWVILRYILMLLNGPKSSYLCNLCRLDDRHIPPCAVFIGWYGIFLAFLPRMLLNLNPLDLHLLRS